jgi:hypothetical protein
MGPDEWSEEKAMTTKNPYEAKEAARAKVEAAKAELKAAQESLTALIRANNPLQIEASRRVVDAQASVRAAQDFFDHQALAGDGDAAYEQWQASKVADPRGPVRRIIAVNRDPNTGRVTVTLDCGHVRERVSHFSYNVGDTDRCYGCDTIQHHEAKGGAQ